MVLSTSSLLGIKEQVQFIDLCQKLLAWHTLCNGLDEQVMKWQVTDMFWSHGWSYGWHRHWAAYWFDDKANWSHSGNIFSGRKLSTLVPSTFGNQRRNNWKNHMTIEFGHWLTCSKPSFWTRGRLLPSPTQILLKIEQSMKQRWDAQLAHPSRSKHISTTFPEKLVNHNLNPRDFLPQDLEAQPEPGATAFTCSTIFLRHSSCLASEGMEPRGMHVGAASDRSELVKVILS